MNTQYTSKHGIVSRPQTDIYMAFTDLRNFRNFLPEDRRGSVTADFDTLSAEVQGVRIGVRVTRREPYSYIELRDDGAPVEFIAGIHFDVVPGEPGKTDFYITAEANLNFMVKMMLGNKVQDALDRVVDGLVDVSNGKVPEGVPEEYRDMMKGL